MAEADVGNVEIDQEVTFTVDAYPNRQFRRHRVYQVRNAPQTFQQNVVIAHDVMIKVDNGRAQAEAGHDRRMHSIVITRHSGVSVRVAIDSAGLRFRMPDDIKVVRRWRSLRRPARSPPRAPPRAAKQV